MARKKIKPTEETIVRVEPSTLMSPIFASNERIFEERVYERKVRGKDGEMLESRTTVGFTWDLGTLCIRDELIYFALCVEWEKQGKPVGIFSPSLRRIAEILQLGWGKLQMDRIRESLWRLNRVDIRFENTFFNATKEKIEDDLEGFRFLTELRMGATYQGENVTSKRCEVQFHSKLIENLRAKYFRPVLLHVLRDLPSANIKSAYLFLDRVTRNPTMKYEAFGTTFIDSIGIKSERYGNPVRRRELVAQVANELNGVPVWNGSLEVSVEIEKGGEPKLIARHIPSPRSQPEPDKLVLLEDDCDQETVNFQNVAQDWLASLGIDRSPMRNEVGFLKSFFRTHPFDREALVFIRDSIVADCKKTGYKVRTLLGLRAVLLAAYTAYLKRCENERSQKIIETERTTETELMVQLEKAGENAWQQLSTQDQDQLVEDETQRILSSDFAKTFRRWTKSTQREHVVGQITKRLGKEVIARELQLL